MKNFIFIILLINIILAMLFKFDASIITGFTLGNIVSFGSFVFLAMFEIATGRLTNKRIPALMLLLLIGVLMFLNVVYLQVYSEIRMPLIAHMRELKNWFIQPFVYYILCFLLVDDGKSARIFLLCLLIILGGLNTISLIGSVFGIDFFPNESYTGSGRFTGLGNPNKTSYLSSMMLPFIYYFFKFSSRFSIKVVSIGLFFLSALTVVLSGSRGGLLCLLLVVFLISIKLRDLRPIISLAVFFLVIMAAVVLNDSVRQNFMIMFERFSLITNSDATLATSSRSDIWKAILEYLISNHKTFIYGLGFGMTKDIGLYAHAHNLYIRVLLELGIGGIIMLFWLLGSVFSFLKKYSVNENHCIKPFIKISIYSILLSFCFTDLGFFKFMAFVLGFALAYLFYQGTNDTSTLSHLSYQAQEV